MGIYEAWGNDLSFTINDFRTTARRMDVLSYIGDGVMVNQDIGIVKGYNVVVLVMNKHCPTP